MDDVQLDVKDIHVFYGNIEAVKGVSFHVNRGEIVSLIGANGAGKTTTLRTVSGLLKPREGAIFYEGQRIDLVPAHEIVTLGVAQSPEGRRIFPRMTVRENLDMGAFIRRDSAGQREDMDRIMELFPILKERERQAAGTLSGGEQQMLAMGRALMARPKLLLLDEPSMGLAPLVVQTIFDTIRDINAQGMTVLLVEQNAAQALSLAHRGYVIETARSSSRTRPARCSRTSRSARPTWARSSPGAGGRPVRRGPRAFGSVRAPSPSARVLYSVLGPPRRTDLGAPVGTPIAGTLTAGGRGSTGPIPCAATGSASLQVPPATMGSELRAVSSSLIRTRSSLGRFEAVGDRGRR